MSEEQFQQCCNEIFDMLSYQKIDKTEKSNQKYMYKSLGIGDQTSQICGVYYLNLIDEFLKYKYQIKYYGRYMDDSYIISKNKNELFEYLEIIKQKSEELRIVFKSKENSNI